MSRKIIGFISVLGLSLVFASQTTVAGEYILKNKARRYCRLNPEKCTATYLMEKFPGTIVTRDNSRNCVNINIQNTQTSSDQDIDEIEVKKELIMGDLTVICD